MSTDHSQPTYEELLAREAARNAHVQPVLAQPQPEQHSAAYQPYPNTGHVPEAKLPLALRGVA